MKYDIPTLLSLRQNACIDIGKFSVHALDNNLLSRRKTNMSSVTERSVNRSRVGSSISVSHHSDESPFGSVANLRYPSRQPNNAPHGTLAQIDAGFARFLKEHASPKHHRVTAGGRIVPMNPRTPAPEFKLSVKKQEGDDLAKGAKSVASTQGRQSIGAEGPSAPDVRDDPNNNFSAAEFPSITGTMPGIATPLLGVDGSGLQHRIQGLQQSLQQSVAMFQTPLLQQQYSLAPNTAQSLQPGQAGQECVTVLPNYAAYNASVDQVAWLPNNGQTLAAQRSSGSFMPPNQHPVAGAAPSFGTATGGVLGMFPSASNLQLPNTTSFYPLSGISGGQVANQTMPFLAQSLPLSGAVQESTTHKSLQEVTKEHETLSAQLANLDRYMALHSWDLDPNSKKILVEQRMSFVRELDALRLYKEQLESSLGNLESKATDTQTVPPPGLQPTSTQLRSGDITNGLNVQTASWMPSFAAGNTPFVWTPTAFAGSLASILPANEPFNGMFPYQFPTIGALTSFPNGFGYGDLRASVGFPYGDQLPHQDWAGNTNHDISGQGTQVYNSMTTDSKDVQSGSDGWTTPTQSAPPAISRVYHRIEEAAKRGESINGLLKELAVVTEKLSRSDMKNVLSSQQEQQMFGSSAENEHVSGLQTSRSKSAYAAQSRDSGEVATPLKAVTQYNKQNKSKKRRSNKSGESNTRSMERIQRAPDEPGDDDDGRSCYSYLSTTDSWATIQEGDKRWLARELKTENEGRASFELLQNPNQNTVGATPGTSMDRPRTGDRVPKIRDTVEWIQTISQQATPGSEQGKFPLSSESSNQEDIKGSPLMLKLWRHSHDQSTSSKKACAPAVSQNINAHAFLPPFDGPGDMPDVGASNPATTNHQGGGPSGDATTGQLSGVNNMWYNKKPREKANPAEVRKFFRRIEEEERNMMHKYRIRHPGA